MLKGMWIAVLTYFGLIAIAAPVMGIESAINWVDVDSVELSEAQEWELYHFEAELEYMREFDAIFDAIEFKVAKNGRSMVKGIHAKSFKFAAK